MTWKLTKTHKLLILSFPTVITLFIVALGPFISAIISGVGLGVFCSQIILTDEVV